MKLSEQCWVHTFQNRRGYTYAYDASTKANVLVHRAVYEVLAGAIPFGLDLDHICRNRGCYNPSHLEPVTRSENIRRIPRPPHCPQGHLRCDDNNRNLTRRNGRYDCRICHNERNRSVA